MITEAADMEPGEKLITRRKPRIILAASGSVASIKVYDIYRGLSKEADVKIVSTSAALHFVKRAYEPLEDIKVYTDEDEWAHWESVNDKVLHVEMRKWADMIVIAPLSANTLAKISQGLSDNLLTCIVRAWDFNKPILVAPAMNTYMWTNAFTAKHLQTCRSIGMQVIGPIEKKLACGDVGMGAMAEPRDIVECCLRVLATKKAGNNG